MNPDPHGKWKNRLLPAMVGLVMLLAGCQQEADQLSGPLGPGTGGPAVNTAALATLNLPDLNGGVIGTTRFDGAYFSVTDGSAFASLVPSLMAYFFALSTATQPAPGETHLLFGPMVGREDTSCRYLAALSMRDDGFWNLAAGERTNDTGLVFYQVNLAGPQLYMNLYCSAIQAHLGIMMIALSTTEDGQGTLQIHQVLNSVSPL